MAANRQSLNVAFQRERPRHTLASVFSSMVLRTASGIRSFHTAPPYCSLYLLSSRIQGAVPAVMNLFR